MARSDKGQPHGRQPDTGLENVYYCAPDHCLTLVVRDEGTRFITRKRSLHVHEVSDAAEQLLDLRDDCLSELGRTAQPDDWDTFARFRQWVAA